jgi:hypothetical protein
MDAVALAVKRDDGEDEIIRFIQRIEDLVAGDGDGLSARGAALPR